MSESCFPTPKTLYTVTYTHYMAKNSKKNHIKFKKCSLGKISVGTEISYEILVSVSVSEILEISVLPETEISVSVSFSVKRGPKPKFEFRFRSKKNLKNWENSKGGPFYIFFSGAADGGAGENFLKFLQKIPNFQKIFACGATFFFHFSFTFLYFFRIFASGAICSTVTFFSFFHCFFQTFLS